MSVKLVIGPLPKFGVVAKLQLIPSELYEMQEVEQLPPLAATNLLFPNATTHWFAQPGIVLVRLQLIPSLL